MIWHPQCWTPYRYLEPGAVIFPQRLRGLITDTAREWARRRQGPDTAPLALRRQRIYILPTAHGLVFALMLLGMLLGAMNYNNNLGFAITFLLAGMGLISMYHCHGNLEGLELSEGSCEPVFAGETARPGLVLENTRDRARYGITLWLENQQQAIVDIEPGEQAEAIFNIPAPRRGRVTVERFSVASLFPFGLFRAWTWVHLRMECIVFPRPADSAPPPPTSFTDTGGAQQSGSGDEDYSGLRDYRPGDSPRHIAWKAFARGQELLVRQFAGTRVVKHVFDFNDVPGNGLEERLSILCRWIIDAHAAGEAFGVKLPGVIEEPGIGKVHLQHCLTHLALFNAPK